MKIGLIPGAISCTSRVRLLNPDQKDNLQKQIDLWLEQGVIQLSVSPWTSPLVLVKKKDGSRVRLLNPYQKNNLRKQIDLWLEQGVIELSLGQWASPLMLVKKKEGRTRWVTYLRELNKNTVKDSYTLTNVQEILHYLHGATVFSSLDVCGAYHDMTVGA